MTQLTCQKVFMLTKPLPQNNVLIDTAGINGLSFNRMSAMGFIIWQ